MSCQRSAATLSALALLLAGGTASAEDRLGVRPGMSLAQVDAVLKGRCATYTVSGEADRFVACATGDGAAATSIDVTVSPKDRVYYVAWHESSEREVLDYTASVATDLGFSGKGKTCKFYDYELRCWTGKDGTVLYSGERDAQKRYVSYLINEQIETEDAGQ